MEFQENITFTTGILGMFIAIPIIALHRQRFANIYLGMFLIAFSLLSIASTSFYISNSQLLGLFDWPLSCLGVFYYLYVFTMCGHIFTKRHLLHFVPFLIFSIILLDDRYRVGQTSFPTHLYFYLLFFQAVTIIYAVATYILLRKYKQVIQNNYSSSKNRDLRWLNKLTLIFISLLILWIPATLFQGVWGDALVVGRLLVLFFVGWYGLRQNFIFIDQDFLELNSPRPTQALDDLSIEEKYQRSGMNDTVRNNIEEKLHKRMLIEKDFLKCDLKLSDLASMIDTSPQHLSEYFNAVLNKNFFTYINELRTAEVKRLLSDPSHQNRSILEIAFDSGFNSKSTFNASFKKNCDISPTAWRKKYLQTS